MKRTLSPMAPQAGEWLRGCVVACLFTLATSASVAAPYLPVAPTAPIAAAPKAVAPAQPSKLVTASWYGPHHHGRRTASGETFDATAFTAAHRTLPFGTLLAVTNPENGRTVMVRVNDRGPFVKGRALDLSEAAARAIGMQGKGVAAVSIIFPN